MSVKLPVYVAEPDSQILKNPVLAQTIRRLIIYQINFNLVEILTQDKGMYLSLLIDQQANTR